MLLNKWVLSGICVVMGSLQAWDSGVLGATVGIQALVAVAILLPAGTLIANAGYGVQAACVAVAFVLLTVARVVSEVPLPTLHIVAFIPAVVIFFSRMIVLRPQAGARGSQG